ncbi:MAG: two-component system sensor histidine kinase CreC [Methylotenera sp.]|uniref:two-component system sensor histidine kinase CreC n=1 Tax=Methylotenera sp. TaxID=2051956 RepID=UPI0017D66EC9|nr:two-component system sensor histidine kinase CreC [Methylotenera sp.]NOU25982.1 two-component system sensor histidine kinase CreC [Methylotenera sp.]
MKISLKIFLGYFLLVGLAAWFVLYVFVDEVKPGVRQAMEDTLVDTANVLAELATNDVKTGTIQTGNFAQSLAQYQSRASKANIWGIKKQVADYRVYITNDKGIVIFDSAKLALGQDYSRWNDVYLTLRGKYGVRSSLVVPGDENSDTIMYIAAPIKEGNIIIGSLTVAKPNRALLPFIERAQSKIIHWGALLFLLSIVIGSLFTWRFTNKINALRDYAVRVTKGEKATPPISSNDELTELALAMQSMRQELDGKQHVQDSIQHLTHELKSPITAIQGALELISPSMPPETQAHFLGQIKAQSNRVQIIIQNMLGLAALEHQQQLQQVSQVNLHELIQTQIKHLNQKTHALQASIHAACRPAILIKADSFLLGQAIHNLLENALDFSPPKSEIKIEVTEKNHQIKITVHDAGAGIPDYALTKVFDKFYSLPRPQNTANAGQKSTGLGLNFVQEVVKLHGGSVTLQNNPNGGAVATITLPM